MSNGRIVKRAWQACGADGHTRLKPWARAMAEHGTDTDLVAACKAWLTYRQPRKPPKGIGRTHRGIKHPSRKRGPIVKRGHNTVRVNERLPEWRGERAAMAEKNVA